MINIESYWIRNILSINCVIMRYIERILQDNIQVGI